MNFKRAMNIFVAILVLFFMIISFQEFPEARVVAEECKGCIVIYNWKEYMDTGIIDDFEKEFKIRVKLKEFSTMNELVSAYEKNPSDADIIIADDYTLYSLENKGLLLALDHTKIPNIENIDQKFKNLHFDGFNIYSVPYFWGTIGIAYNAKFVREKVDSWSIFWDEKYNEKKSLLADPRAVSSAVLLKLGYPINTENETALLEAKKELAKAKLKILDTLEAESELIESKIYLAQTYNGDAAAAMFANPDIRYVLPKEGCIFWIDSMAISKNSKNPEAAYKFINFILRPEINARNSNSQKYASPLLMEKIEKLLRPEILSNDVIYPKNQSMNCEFILPSEKEKMHYDILKSYMEKWRYLETITGVT